MSRQMDLFAQMSSVEDGPAKETAWLDGVLEWLTSEADFGAKLSAFLPSSVPSGFLEKTSLVFCPSAVAPFAEPSMLSSLYTRNGTAEKAALALDAKTDNEFDSLIQDEISSRSWPTWKNWGMGSPTRFATLSGSEFPKDAAASSLSDVLETGDVPQKYFLSAKACRGILNRAAKRGRKLPPALEAALTQAATSMETKSVEP